MVSFKTKASRRVRRYNTHLRSASFERGCSVRRSALDPSRRKIAHSLKFEELKINISLALFSPGQHARKKIPCAPCVCYYCRACSRLALPPTFLCSCNPLGLEPSGRESKPKLQDSSTFDEILLSSFFPVFNPQALVPDSTLHNNLYCICTSYAYKPLRVFHKLGHEPSDFKNQISWYQNKEQRECWYI